MSFVENCLEPTFRRLCHFTLRRKCVVKSIKKKLF